MAYQADIFINVKGFQDLTRIQKALEGTARKIDEVNTAAARMGAPVRNIERFSKQLDIAGKALQKVAIGSPQEQRAISNYVTALNNSNVAKTRQNKLIQEEITRRNSATIAIRENVERNIEESRITRQVRSETQALNAELVQRARLERQLASRGLMQLAGGQVVKGTDAGFGIQGPAVPPGGIPKGPKNPIRGTTLSSRLSAGAIGGAFPLLFGGGPGAVLGGLAGGLAGGGGPAGMAASLALSAFGQIIDKFAVSARNAGDALKDPAKTLQVLAEAGFQVSGMLGDLVKALIEDGRAQDALRVIHQDVARTIGYDGIRALEDLDTQWDKTSNAVAELALALATKLAPAFTIVLTDLEKFILELRGIKPEGGPSQTGEFLKRAAWPFALAAELTGFGKTPQQPSDAGPSQFTQKGFKQKELDIQLNYERSLKQGTSYEVKLFNTQQEFIRKRAELELKYEEKLQPIRQNVINDIKNGIDTTTQAYQNNFSERLSILKTQQSSEFEILNVQEQQSVLRMRIEETRKREADIVEAQLMREQAAVQVAAQRDQMQASIASAATSAYLALNDLEMQRATNAGDTEKQYRLQLQRAQLIYQQTVLQVEQEQRKAELAVLSSQIKLKELEATVAQKAAKGEAVAQDYAAIQLQKQAVELAYEGVNAAKQIAQYNLMGADAVRQMAIEQAAFNRAQSAGRTAMGGGGGAMPVGGGGGVTVSSNVTTRSLGMPGPAELAPILAAAGYSGHFTEEQALGLARKIIEEEKAKKTARAKEIESKGGGAIQKHGEGVLFYAEGGYVTRPTNAMVGEGGQPEYVIPASKMNDAMRRYSAGTRGEAVITGAGAPGASNSSANYTNQQNTYYGSGGGTSVNITTGPVLRMNNKNYVSVSDMQRGLAAAVGAAESNMMNRMSRSYATRRSMGL